MGTGFWGNRKFWNPVYRFWSRLYSALHATKWYTLKG